MKRALILSGICCIIAFQLGGCKSELKDPLPTSPDLPGVHPAGWTTKTSPEFHGIVARTDDGQCRQCHGSDYKGGISKVSCGTSGCHGPNYHPAGFGNPSSSASHRFFLRTTNHNLAACKTCHATDYSGGPLSGNVSCNNTACHRAADGGPEACYTCHGEYATKVIYPIAHPAHATHIVGADLSAIKLACQACHNVTGFNDPNHLGGSNPNGAEVTLADSLAAVKTKGAVGDPQYDIATGTCKNVYCHGNFTNGNNPSVSWKGTDQAKCGTCHGDPATGSALPKAPHPQVQTCYTCHAGVIDNTGQIIDKTKHINGKLNRFGNEETNW